MSTCACHFLSHYDDLPFGRAKPPPRVIGRVKEREKHESKRAINLRESERESEKRSLVRESES